jgi:hypothetical protein
VTLSATDELPDGSPGVVTSVSYRYRPVGGAQGATVTAPGATASFTLPVDGEYEIEYWAEDEDGNVETHEFATIYYDSVAPTGALTLRGRSYTSFDGSPGFEIFAKIGVPVAITGTDEFADIVTVEYLKLSASDAGTTLIPYGTAVAADEAGGWQPYTVPVPVSAAAIAGEKAIVYARITDEAGNRTILNTPGVVSYVDGAASTANITYVKTSAADVTADVTLNGNLVGAIVNGTTGGTLAKGVDYTVNGGTISFKASYLDTLTVAGGPYSLQVSYLPVGETYATASSPGRANDVPESTTIALNVVNASAEATLTISPASGAVYGANNVTLSAIVRKSAGTGDRKSVV